MSGFNDVAAFAVDVGVSVLVDKGLASKFGPGSGFVREMVGGAISGAAGGAAGRMFQDGAGFNNAWNGAVDGAIGGAVGSGIGYFWGKNLTKGKTAADDAVKEADSAKKTADDDVRLLDEAEPRLENARLKAEDAERNVERLKQQLDDLKAQNPPPRDAEIQRQITDKESQLHSAEDVARDAQRELDEAIVKNDDAEADRYGVQDAQRKAEDGLDKAKKIAEKKGKSLEDFGKWQRGTLIGLGSAIGMYVGSHDMWWEDSAGGTPGAAVNKVDLQWDGYAPAAAAGVMGTLPFQQGSSPQAGKGFLLRPVGLNPSIAEWFGGPSNSFAFSLVDTYQMFGDLKKRETLTITPIPKMPATVEGVKGSAGGASYQDKSNSLNQAAETLTKTQGSVLDAIQAVEKVSTFGKENVGKLIVGFNQYVVANLQGDSDIEFISVMGQGFAELVNELERWAAENNAAAGLINQPTTAQDQAAAKGLADSVGNYANQQQSPGLTPDSSQIGVNNPWDPGNLGTGPGSTPDTSDLKDSADRFRDQAEGLSGSANTPSNITPASYDPGASQLGAGLGAGAAGLGADSMGMSNLMSSLLPMMMQQQAMRNMADNDMSGRMDDIDPSRFDQAAVPTLPQAQQPVGTTPWSNQAAANNAAATPATQPATQHPVGAPNGATSTQPGGGVPQRMPGEDGLVPYAFPDGRTQRVQPTVAQALDKAFANKSGTDAQAAYKGTPGAWEKSKDIGEGVYPPKTGDVATFIIRQPKTDSQKPEPVPARADGEPRIQPAAMVTVGGDTGEEEKPPKDKPDTGSSDEPTYRTALLVAFGEGESGTLEVVVNGELQQYREEMSDTEGDFGEFAGFKHPKGVEAVGDKPQDSETMATSGDQTTADIPALAMPV